MSPATGSGPVVLLGDSPRVGDCMLLCGPSKRSWSGGCLTPRCRAAAGWHLATYPMCSRGTRPNSSLSNHAGPCRPGPALGGHGVPTLRHRDSAPPAPRLEGDPPLKQMIRVYFRSGFDDSGSGSFEAMRRTISAAGIMATAPRTPTGGASRRSPALKRMNSPAIPLRAP